MSTLKSRLTGLLVLNRNVFNRIDTTAHGNSAKNTRPPKKVTGAASQPESQQTENKNRPDWFQAIHGTDS